MNIMTIEFDARLVRPGDPRIYILLAAQSLEIAWNRHIEEKPHTRHSHTVGDNGGCNMSVEERINHAVRSMVLALYGIDAPSHGGQLDRILDVHGVVVDLLRSRNKWASLCKDLAAVIGVDAFLVRGVNAPPDAPQHVYELETPQFRAVYEVRR